MGRTPGAKNKVKDIAYQPTDVKVGHEIGWETPTIQKDVIGSVTLTTVNGNVRVFVPISGATKFYEFANGRKLEVYNPRYLNTTGGSHRIICDDGTCLYIKPSEGWFMHWQNYTLLDSNYIF